MGKERFLELTVTGFSKKGYGRADVLLSSDEAVTRVDIPYTVPGDLVLVSCTKKRRGALFGKVEKVMSESPLRVPPKCSHFGSCGGCRWQHISYEEQLKLKEQGILKAFSQFSFDPKGIFPIIPSVTPFEYRNKMEFTFSTDASGKRYLGLVMAESSRKVVDLHECHLVKPWFLEALKCVRSWWEETLLEAYHMNRDEGSLRTLVVREGTKSGDRLVMLTVSGNPQYEIPKPHIQLLITRLKEALEDDTHELSLFLRVQQIAKGVATNFFEMNLYGKPYFEEKLQMKLSDEESKELVFRVSPTSFFQPNTIQAERLFSAALRLAEVSPQDVLYDLYCGTGTIGICFAPFVKQVIGIELSSEAASDAKFNASLNHLTNYSVFSGAVRHTLEYLVKRFPKPDILIVDPPRVGLDQQTKEQLFEMLPKKIIYVSCNPETQVVDVQDFLNKGYRIKAIQPVDQFPQTVHVENICVLELV
jgi:23S rRNA (uracil1939-C5)-methyltransferase